ncbi:hypothetical protein M1D72_00280 [Vibrio sp. AK197]
MMQVYKDILEGIVSVDDGKKILGSQPDFDGKEVFVTPEIIILVLGKFICDEIDSKHLFEWAKFLTNNDIYVTQGWEDDATSDKYEPMWEILQILANPVIDGPVDKPRAKDFVEALKSLG